MTVTALFPQQAQDTRFLELWTRWPKDRRTKKPATRAKYEAVLHGVQTRTLDRDSGLYIDIYLKATEEEILAGAKDYLSAQIDPNTYKLKDGGKYIPELCTWLNRGMWEL